MCQYLFEILFPFSMDTCPRSGIAGTYDSSFLKNLYVVFYSSCHQLTFPPVVHRGSLFTSLPTLISSLFVCFSDDSHSNRYGLVDLNGVMLSEINLVEKDKSCGLSLICEI